MCGAVGRHAGAGLGEHAEPALHRRRLGVPAAHRQHAPLLRRGFDKNYNNNRTLLLSPPSTGRAGAGALRFRKVELHFLLSGHGTMEFMPSTCDDPGQPRLPLR